MKTSWIASAQSPALILLAAILSMVLIIFLTPVLIFAQRDDAQSATAVQSASLVTLIPGQDKYPLGLHLAILEDQEKTWTIEDITSPEIAQQFLPNTDAAPGFGFTDSAFWVRFNVQNEVDPSPPWMLVIDSYLFYIDVYLPVAEAPNGYEVVQTGTVRPYATRAIDHPQFLFELSIPQGEEQTIYARFESETAMNLSLAIWSAQAVAQDDLVTQMLNGVLYGVLLIMAGYNFILFIFLRDRSYLYYVLFLLTLLLSNLTNDGIAHKYLWPEQGRFNAIGGQFFFFLLIIFLLLFTNSFLQLKKHAPRLRKAVRIVIGAYCVLLPIQWINASLTARPGFILTAISLALVVASGIIVWRKGYHPARYFLLAWLLLLASILLFMVSLFVFGPLNLYSIVGTQIGIIVLVLTLSSALADRINTYRNEKDAAQREQELGQQEMLHKQEEFTKSLQQSNKELAEQYEERVHDLGFAHEQLESLFKHSTLAIGTAAMDGRVLTANDALKRILGYPNGEIFAANVLDFFADEVFRNELMAQLIAEKIVRAPMVHLKRKDGTVFYANITESILTRKDESVFLGIIDDITEQVLAEQEQQKKAEETAVSVERERIARELHDSVTQTLYSASLIAEAVPKFWQQQPDEAEHDLEELRVLTQGAQAEMRTLLLELRPSELIDRKLSELLRQLTDAMAARSEMPISLTVTGDCKVPPDVQIALYRITQEALNNINKHAQADRAWVILRCNQEGVTLRVGDNGRGFESQTRQIQQLGLKIMHERAETINAELTIESQPGEGTVIAVNWQVVD